MLPHKSLSTHTFSFNAFVEFVGCNPLVTPQQGKVKCTNGNEVGSACTLSCDKNKGLTIQGNETRRCLYDHRNGVAHWNGEPFTCGG